jgi:hypothetical protein
MEHLKRFGLGYMMHWVWELLLFLSVGDKKTLSISPNVIVHDKTSKIFEGPINNLVRTFQISLGGVNVPKINFLKNRAIL